MQKRKLRPLKKKAAATSVFTIRVSDEIAGEIRRHAKISGLKPGVVIRCLCENYYLFSEEGTL